MYLQNINISPQSLHTRIHRIEDMFPRQPNLVDPFHSIRIFWCKNRNIILELPGQPLASLTPCPQKLSGTIKTTYIRNTIKAFSQDNELLPGDVVLLDSFTDYTFTRTIGVNISCVPGIYSEIESGLEEGEGFFLILDPSHPPGITKRHGPEDDLRGFKATIPNPRGDELSI